jgi:hypothetical protein
MLDERAIKGWMADVCAVPGASIHHEMTWGRVVLQVEREKKQTTTMETAGEEKGEEVKTATPSETSETSETKETKEGREGVVGGGGGEEEEEKFAAFAGVTVSGIFDGGLGMVRGVARIAKTDNKYLTGKAAAGMAGAAAGDSVEMKEMKEVGGDDKGQDGSTGRAGEAGAAGGDDSQGGETKREDGADSEAKATLKAAKACGLHWEVHASWSHWSETMGVEWPMRVRQL